MLRSTERFFCRGLREGLHTSRARPKCPLSLTLCSDSLLFLLSFYVFSLKPGVKKWPWKIEVYKTGYFNPVKACPVAFFARGCAELCARRVPRQNAH